MERYFQISVHALIATAFVALALTGRLDPPSMLVFAAGLTHSAYRTLRSRPPLLSARGAFTLSCFYILFFLFDTAVISGSFIPATIHLVLFLELTKMYQDKTDRDYLYLIVLPFTKILAASSLTIDMSFVATLLLFLVALVSTLMSFDMYRSERRLTAAARGNVAARLGGMSLWATACIVVVAVVLFLAIPRAGTGYFSRAATPALLLSGFSENVQLGEIGQVKLSSAVVMRARRLEGARHAVLKWRGIALDTFDGHVWTRSDRRRTTVYASESSDGEETYIVRPPANRGELVRYEILLEPLATTTLFGPFEVRRITGRIFDGPRDWRRRAIAVDADGALHMRIGGNRRLQYTVTSEIPRVTGLFQSAAPAEPTGVADRYLQLPPDLDPQVAALAAEVTARGRTVQEKAALVEAYLKRNYRYTLDLDWEPGPQPMRTFLLDARRGHCEYFASSMAILLRSVGIPTRLVNGFLMGEYNPLSDSYIVRQSDAHSWVEVFIPDRGWVEFDPTPPDPNRPEMTLARQLAHYIDAMQLYWNSYILIYDTGLQAQLFRSAQDRIQSAQAAARERAAALVAGVRRLSGRLAEGVRGVVDGTAFWIAAAIAAVAAALYHNRHRVRIRWAMRRLRKGAAVAPDIVEQMFYRTARRAGFRGRQPAETWREWVAAIPDVRRRALLNDALGVFERSRYGGAAASAEDVAVLEAAARALRSQPRTNA